MDERSASDDEDGIAGCSTRAQRAEEFYPQITQIDADESGAASIICAHLRHLWCARKAGAIQPVKVRPR